MRKERGQLPDISFDRQVVFPGLNSFLQAGRQTCYNPSLSQQMEMMTENGRATGRKFFNYFFFFFFFEVYIVDLHVVLISAEQQSDFNYTHTHTHTHSFLYSFP